MGLKDVTTITREDGMMSIIEVMSPVERKIKPDLTHVYINLTKKTVHCKHCGSKTSILNTHITEIFQEVKNFKTDHKNCIKHQ